MLDLSLPTGLRDLLPDHSAHLAELSGRLQQVFASFGYRRLFLPTLERLDVVERGLSAAALADVMKFVEPGSGEVVAIRPDITPQIARLYAARPDALPSPARLCYDGPVLRAREARAGRPREVYQAGVELLGVGGARYDAEALVVLAKALARVGLGEAVIEVGHARFGAAAIEAAGLPKKALAEAWDALARKDEGVLTALAVRGRGAASAREALPRLAGLYGDGALQRARAFARLVPGCGPALAEVEAALKLARRKGLGEVAVVLKHGLRNALVPVITMMGLQFGFLLGGSIVVEKVFNWPGMGRLLVDAVDMHDYPVIQAEVLLFSLEFILINLAVDVLYGAINPVIRYE